MPAAPDLQLPGLSLGRNSQNTWWLLLKYYAFLFKIGIVDLQCPFEVVAHVFVFVQDLVFSFNSKCNACNCRHLQTTTQLADWTVFSCRAQLILRGCFLG